jgi:hypothetical protein
MTIAKLLLACTSMQICYALLQLMAYIILHVCALGSRLADASPFMRWLILCVDVKVSKVRDSPSQLIVSGTQYFSYEVFSARARRYRRESDVARCSHNGTGLVCIPRYDDPKIDELPSSSPPTFSRIIPAQPFIFSTRPIAPPILFPLHGKWLLLCD